MTDLLPEFIVWGVQDSFSPGHIAVLAWFIAACLSLSHDRKALVFFSISFILVFYGLCLVLLMDFMGSLFMNNWYPVFSNSVIMIIGAWLFFTGLGLFMRWFQEIRVPSGGTQGVTLKVLPFAGILRVPAAVLTAVVLAFALASWTPTSFVTVYSYNMILPGKRLMIFSLLAVYSLMKVFFMILAVAGVFVLTRNTAEKKKAMLSRSTDYILMSAVFIAIGVGVIIVSFNRIW